MRGRATYLGGLAVFLCVPLLLLWTVRRRVGSGLPAVGDAGVKIKKGSGRLALEPIPIMARE